LKHPRFLLCPPTHFGIEYVINPWMEGQLHASDSDIAVQQWCRFQKLLSEVASVTSIEPVAGLPDLVFTANAALIFRGSAILSNFRCLERRPESAHFAAWLAADGFDVYTLPDGVFFEGAGDALFERDQPFLWAGHGFRSHASAKPFLEKWTGVEVQLLKLKDPRFYHLDTCFCPLEGGHLLYFSEAFDAASNAAIEARFPPDRRFDVGEQDATSFACNAVNIGNHVILNRASSALKGWLAARGFQVAETGVSEFMKAGGATKCLSLRLDER
jgi:N-dimethylarginine dimethylaminohydrolase